MVSTDTLLAYLIMGPFGIALTFLKYGLSFGVENAATPLSLYTASSVGTALWASIFRAIGELVE